MHWSHWAKGSKYKHVRTEIAPFAFELTASRLRYIYKLLWAAKYANDFTGPSQNYLV